MNLPLLACLLLVPGAGERENRRGIEALRRADTSASVEHFESALAADTTAADYAFNAATAKALAGKDGEAEFARALSLAADRDERARVLYNRGTARLRKAVGAPPGQGDVAGAIADLREALKLRPSWKDASRNLERALRLRPPPQPPQDPKGGDGPKKQPKPEPGDPKPQDAPPSPEKKPSPGNPAEGMDPRDARRLLDGAAAREAQQAKETKQRKNEESDGPDW
jgi:tetratricopeptide (TPR) repeat protein